MIHFSLSIFLPHVWQGCGVCKCYRKRNHHTVVYYCITRQTREPEGDERWGGTGRAKAFGSEREGAQRKPLDPKAKERRGGSGRAEASGSIVYIQTSGH
jgi:hypothetical protein